MKIESSAIDLASQHASSRRVAVEETLRAWVGHQRPDFENRSGADHAGTARPSITLVTISFNAQQAAATARPSAEAQATAEVTDASDQARHDPKMQLIIGMIEALTGEKVRFFRPQDLKPAAAPAAPPAAPSSGQTAAPQPRQGWGLEYDRHETLHESEQTSVSAQGVIKTSDGREIEFALTLTMARSFSLESSQSIRLGDGIKKDPLVINFSGAAAQLTDTRFSFDLDSDGEVEKMAFVGPASGFLALDRNGNGNVDNGSELFGTRSGNGFADLAAHDLDGNHWIDENDPVYSRLQVWRKDASGQDSLNTLSTLKVGALYLGNVASPFELKDATHALQGQVSASGLYLDENGNAGSLQQIDLVV